MASGFPLRFVSRCTVLSAPAVAFVHCRSDANVTPLEWLSGVVNVPGPPVFSLVPAGETASTFQYSLRAGGNREMDIEGVAAVSIASVLVNSGVSLTDTR